MTRTLRTLIATAALALGLGLFTAPAHATSERQLAYNACVNAYNNVFRTLTGSKAIVAGVTGGRYQCFWSWDSDSAQEAINSAMNRCYANQSRCFVFATEYGMQDWAMTVSNMGGNDGSTARAQQDAFFREAAETVVGFGVGAIIGSLLR